MIEETISARRARAFYDRIGPRYDWTTFFESEAKSRAIVRLALEPGLKVLDAGAGTGNELAQIQAELDPGGLAFGLDASFVMAQLTNRRSAAGSFQALANQLPIRPETFDRIYAAYLLDLLPISAIPGLLNEFKRVLAPGGLIVLLSLTEGIDPVSRTIVGGWKFIYRMAPIACGGCRPLQLEGLVLAAGFKIQSLEIIKEWGVPSELVVMRP